jgi:C-terminal processing protease CtpA/Prc
MCLAPEPGFTPPGQPRAGLSAIKLGPDSFQVLSVERGSPADRAGIHVGDRIVAINGHPAADMSGADLSDLVRQQGSAQIALSLVRAEQHEDVTLALP